MQRTARLIRRAIKKREFSEIPHLIQGKNLKGVKLRLPYTTPNIVQLLVDKEVELSFYGLDSTYNRSWESIIHIATILKLSGFIPSIRVGRCHLALRRYLDLTNTTYHIIDGDILTFGEISEISDPRIQKKAFKRCLGEDRYYHIRVLLETGYIPSVEEFYSESSFMNYTYRRDDVILLTYPLPWTDELYYRWISHYYRDFYNYFIFWDMAYLDAWEGVVRFINAHPGKEINQDIKYYLRDKILPESAKQGYHAFREKDGYPITNYNHCLLFQFSDDQKWKSFIDLIKQDRNLYRCCDPRFLHHWERLTHPDNDELFKEVINKNPLAEEYLIHKGLLAKDYNLPELIESDKIEASHKLIELVRDGLVSTEMLGPDHPLTSVIKCRTTKRAR